MYGVEAPNVTEDDALKAANDNIADLRASFEAYKRRAPQQKAKRHRFAITNPWLSESSDTGATDVPANATR
jgi:hypothetical protein